MARAEICPVCSGTGVYPKLDPDDKTQVTPNLCHGCQGKGWISVEDTYPPYYPYYPYFPHYPYYPYTII